MLGDYTWNVIEKESECLAQRFQAVTKNIANANTTRTQQGGAYHRRYVVFMPREKEIESFEEMLKRAVGDYKKSTGEGVRAVAIAEDNEQGPLVYDPTHPDANEEGYVEKPNVNIVAEMVDMITAQRAYEANATAINAAKSMAMKALDISGS